MSDRRRARVWVRAAAVVAIGSIVAACGGAADGSNASASPGGPRATTPPPIATEPAALAPIAVDARLLGILPATVAGAPIQPAPDSATQMAGDPALGQAASGVAVGIVVAPGDSGGDDLAIASVIQLRPGIFDDGFYDDWRAAYDRAACEPAGGVSSHVQQLVGPHTVEVTVCGEGARTYHTHLPGDRLVSVTAVGDRDFGHLVMAGLRQ